MSKNGVMSAVRSVIGDPIMQGQVHVTGTKEFIRRNVISL